MSGTGKDAYNAYHVALGTKEVMPFERIAIREQGAWQVVARETEEDRQYAENAQQELRHAENELDESRIRCDQLRDELDECIAKQKQDKKA